MSNDGKNLQVGLAARMEGFFERNTGEYLTDEDACQKFGCTAKQLNVALRRLRMLGTVETVRVLRRKA